jgi:hypothetical protein
VADAPEVLADRFLELLRARTATNDDDAVRERFIANYQQLEAALADPPARDAVLARLASFLGPGLSDWDFACTANTCGMAVEAGGDPAVAAGPLLERLPTLLAGAKDLAERLHARFGNANLEAVPEATWEEAARTSPEVGEMVRRFLGIAFAGRAAMTMLCRAVPLRHYARRSGELVEAVLAGREYNPYANYLAELLGAADDEEIVVLDVGREIGFRVRLTAVRNNFHFFTLLQHALAAHPAYADRGGPPPVPLFGAIARGERLLSTVTEADWAATGSRDETGEPIDRGLWAFYQWPALQPDGVIETAALAAPHQPWWAWGETRPYELADLDGVRLLLIDRPEPANPRAWGVGFFAPLHPALRSAVTIEKELSGESVKAWVADIRAVPRQPTDAAAG